MLKQLFIFLIITFSYNVLAQNSKELLVKAYTSKDSSDYYFKKAKNAIKNDADEAEYYFCKNAFHTDFGTSDSAIYYGETALKKFKDTKNYNSIITIYNNLGRAYNDKGQYENAIRNRISGLKLAERHNLQNWIGNFYIGLSYDYHDFEDYPKGIYYGKKAIHYFLNKKDAQAKDIRSSFNATAINYDDWNKPEQALFYHKQNLKYIKGKDTLLLHSTFNNIGNTLLKQKKFEEAKKWLLRSVKILDFKVKQNDILYTDYDYATCYTNLATIATELNQYEEAKNYFDLAFEYSKKSETAEKLRDYYQQKIIFNKKYNKLAEAIEEQENYIKLRDSIYTTEKNKTITELETKYQTEKKEKQILQHQAEVKQKNIWLLLISSFTIIGLIVFRNFRAKAKLQKEQLELENKLLEEQSNYKIQEQRLDISRELHDNVGSQLTFIISILDNLKSSSVQFDDAIDKKIDTLTNFANKSISELRDTIWVLNSKQLSLFELKTRMTNFIKDASESVDTISFHFDFDIQNDVQLSSKQAINLYRILQEIVNNAIKHANAKDISVSISQIENELQIKISDNGIGFDYESQKRKSFGLTNIKNRIQEINGNLEVESNETKGTNYSIKVKL
ncbi:tetratricopeptide repeat-containing sensor histidine kinase [Flavobacterium sasangense]|uniref:tetratricopeptide repeat-containing sensor histidine kinase n=1 Tax=Flavobacterium sasangense TaxID=503361 RepID=UPI000478B063|nr:sensor histidine kinase [Flavobacterium sasangense]